MKTFTPDSWAHESRIPLAQAIRSTEDMVEMGQAVPVDEHHLRLTQKGIEDVRAVRDLQAFLDTGDDSEFAEFKPPLRQAA